MDHVTEDELYQNEVYTQIGRLRESVEQFEEEAEDCEEDEEMAFSALVWLGKLIKTIFAKSM